MTASVIANPYHYADNDPINKTDPLGLTPTDLEFAYVTAVGACATVPATARSGSPPTQIISSGACLRGVGLILAATTVAATVKTGSPGIRAPKSKQNTEEEESPRTTVEPLPPSASSRCTAPQGADDCGGTEVLIDTSAVYKYKTLVPLLESRGERGVISTQVELELQNNTYKNPYPAHPGSPRSPTWRTRW
jgi:hypothetical protein